MKVILSKILYYVGDFISKLMNYDCFAWLYPLYNRTMSLSCDLDKHGKIWKIAKRRKLRE
jgi:hypothetical protein